MMESHLLKLQFLNLTDATAEERELLHRLQSVALAGHCKVTLPVEEASPPSESPEPEVEDVEKVIERAESPALTKDDTPVYETCRQPPDGTEFAAEESSGAPVSAPPPPALMSQSQGLLGDMPAMGPGGMMQPAMQPMPMPPMMPGAQHHQMYHSQQQQHCPPNYHPMYMNNMMFHGGYIGPGYQHHEAPPMEPEPRGGGGGRRGNRHGKQDKTVYGGSGGYTMTSRTAAGPPLVMSPYAGHTPYPMFQMPPYHHGYYYPSPMTPEMMMPAMPPHQQMDVPAMPQPALVPAVPEPPHQVHVYAGSGGVSVAGSSVASSDLELMVESAPSGPPPASDIPVTAATGRVRLSFGFDLEDKLSGDAGDNTAVQLDTASPVLPPCTNTPTNDTDCPGEADNRLCEGRPSSSEPGETASRLLGGPIPAPGETASRLLGGPIPASYVATVTVSARVIDCDELKRCASPADSQDSGVAHTDMELGSPVTVDTTPVEAVPPVEGPTQAVQASHDDLKDAVSAPSVTTEALVPLQVTPADPMEVTTSIADTTTSSPAAATPVSGQPPTPANTEPEPTKPDAAPVTTPPPPAEKASDPAPTPAPAPAPATPWGGTRSWASLFSKKPDSGGTAPPPAPTPKQPPPPPPPATDSELLALGAALARFEPSYKMVFLQPRGLTNKSNWCYINAVLQAMASCLPFYHLMKVLPTNVGLQTGQSRTPIIDAMVEFIRELKPLHDIPRVTRRERERGQLRDLSLGAPFEPSYVYNMLSRVSSDAFRVAGRQEDAEEFLTCLLSGLQDEMADVLKVYEKNLEGERSVNGSTNGREEAHSDDDSDEWQTINRKNRGQVTRSAELQTTPISRIFSGQLRSALHRQGSKATATVQSFFSLQLDIQSTSVTCVEEALEQLTGRDAVHGVTCPTTGRPVEAWQQVALELVPPTLILHLKRFLYDPATDGVQKLMKRVTYPVDLELKRDLLSSARGKLGPGQKRYRLFAVVYHAGKESSKGHYITDAFHPAYQQWVRYDDSSVSAVLESAVLKPESPLMPYILFYRRLEPHAAHNGK